ncbi:hypothetical protein [Vibrio campbellii]|uniref:hypothetical protein n=1 Tax=Vibrio campbellii TaxID=680 RepID=UPI002109C671|nr:hypothetical protein [Vibrio campbellii]UTZ44517.1 hypothetical protein HB764_24980 [Vibrio campbellii]
MNDDIADLKRQHLESRKQKRDQENKSILGQFDVELEPDADLQVIESCSDAEVSLDDKPAPCKACCGKGWVKPLFFRTECDRCFGTTYDLTNPVAIIKWQQLCLEWAKKDVKENRRALLHATTTSEERKAKAVEGFYQDARRKD